jgi:hypothetical protein
MKNKIDKIDGRDPWEIEIEYYLSLHIGPEAARAHTISRWMQMGDLRPLHAAIVKALASDNNETAALVDKEILESLKTLIDDGRLVVKPRRGGRPESSEKYVRNLNAALRYEKVSAGKKSDVAYKEVARDLGMTEATVREAVTEMRTTHPEWRKRNAG